MFGEFYKTSKLLEQEMREANHDISPVNVLTVKKKDLENCAKIMAKFNINHISTISISLLCCLYCKI